MKILILCTLFFAGNSLAAEPIDLSARLQNILTLAREQVPAKLRAFDPASSSSAPEAVLTFFREHAKDLAADIESSQYEFLADATNPLGTCLLTHTNSKAPVLFHLKSCANVNYEDMIRFLVHESIHHLGISDESFAYAASEFFFTQTQSAPFQNIVVDCEPITRDSIFSVKVLKKGNDEPRIVVMAADPSGPLTLGIGASQANILTDRASNPAYYDHKSIYYNNFETGGADFSGVLELTDLVVPQGTLGYFSFHCHSARCQSLRQRPDYPFPDEPDYFMGFDLFCRETK